MFCVYGIGGRDTPCSECPYKHPAGCGKMHKDGMNAWCPHGNGGRVTAGADCQYKGHPDGCGMKHHDDCMIHKLHSPCKKCDVNRQNASDAKHWYQNKNK